VSPGLQRVRHDPRRRQKETFTAFLDHVIVDSLRNSFLALPRHAATGMDGLTRQAPEHAKQFAFGAIAMDYRHGPGLQTRRESDGTTTVVLFGGDGLLLLNETQPVIAWARAEAQ
jgi:hypothetical protein